MDKYRNPLISFNPNKDKQILINLIQQLAGIVYDSSLLQLKKENAPEYRYNLAWRCLATTNKAICEALNMPVEADARYKKILEKSEILIQFLDKFICPFTFHKAHFLTTDSKEFSRLQISNIRQLNLFEKGDDHANS